MAANTTVRELLESKEPTIHSVGPDATVFEAVKKLSEAKIGALPVMDGNKVMGMFSERDYARKIILEGKTSKDTKVTEIMSADVQCVSPDNTVKECMTMMTKNRFRHLPVLENDQLIGIVSIGDIVRAILMSLLDQ
jgi:CBS domain-containing protein